MPTITEALQETKTIVSRIEKKREFLSNFLWRQNHIKDPHDNEGGSQVVVRSTLQAIHDLENNLVDTRRKIAMANDTTIVTINNVTKSISEWLIWRREVAINRKRFLEKTFSAIQGARQQASANGLKVVKSEDQAGDSDIIVNLNETKLADEIEQIEVVLSTLDGVLSLKNATIEI